MARRIYVRDHRQGREREFMVYATADIDLALKMASDENISRYGCQGKVEVHWAITPLQLTPSRYDDPNFPALDQPINIVRTYDQDDDGCVLQVSRDDLQLGKWRVAVQTPTWGTACDVVLDDKTGKALVNFRSGLFVCALGLNFPSAPTAAESPILVKAGGI
ncbi:MAG: hypothetical protein AABM32_04665 [Chloroflexota bacterium]